MATYLFERAKDLLAVNEVKTIIQRAGDDTGNSNDYIPDAYEYENQSPGVVRADGPGAMSVNPLEKAANEIGYGTVKVLRMDDVSDNATTGSARVPRMADSPPGATRYGVTIVLPPETVADLSASGYSLSGFKAVRTNRGGGAPLVWFKSDDFGLSTDISWENQYEAYTSRSAILPNDRIIGLRSYPIDLGQRLEVRPPQGNGIIVAGMSGILSVGNLTTNKLTCGISEAVNGSIEPLCAFPLWGRSLDYVVPTQKVMLTFSTRAVDTGTVIDKAYGRSIVIDLTSATHREVSFDINKGWSWGGFSWATAIRPSTNVRPILIDDMT